MTEAFLNSMDVSRRISILSFLPLLFTGISVTLLSACGNVSKTTGSNDSADSITNDVYALSDTETEDMYGDSPEYSWSFEVLTKEDKPTSKETAHLHTGGFEYKAITLRTHDGYVAYSNQIDYQSWVHLFYLVDHLASKYSRSGDTYPSKKDWEVFQSEVLNPLRDGASNWEVIPVKKWRKEAGDYYYALQDQSIYIGNRGSDRQSYYFIEYNWKHILTITEAEENNEYNLPEGALIIRTITWIAN